MGLSLETGSSALEIPLGGSSPSIHANFWWGERLTARHCRGVGLSAILHLHPMGKHLSTFPHWKVAGQKQHSGAEWVMGRGCTPSLDMPPHPPVSPAPTAGVSRGRSRSWPHQWPAGRSSRRRRSHPTCCCTPCGRRHRGASRRSSGRAGGSPHRRSQ